MKPDITTPVLIIGSGPAGSTSAMRLLERGITPLVLERESFPRFHIGESMTGECGALLRDLGLGDTMVSAGHPVKHGVSVYGVDGAHEWWLPVMQRLPDGDLRDQWTWQVRRSIFDHMLLDEAVARGAQVISGRAVEPIMDEDGRTVCGIVAHTTDGETVRIAAELTLDCSGQATFLANQKVTGPKYLGSYDRQIAVFSQVSGYVRDDGPERSEQPGNTHIFYKRKYHWAWAIPIDDEITSVGVVVPADYFKRTGESKADFLRREYRELNPALSDRIVDTTLVDIARVIPNYSYQVRGFTGPGFICVGDAHRFIDPIFSFGLYVAMKEAGLAAEQAAGWLDGRGRDSDSPFAEYAIAVEKAADILEDTLDTFWENPLAFSVFVHRRYRSPMLDVFAGRIYDGMPNDGRDAAMSAFRKLLKRDRTYDDDLYSVPIGSRYHPERAPLWNAELDSVETTERWLRDAG